MQIICPECHTLYKTKKPILNNRLKCKKCKTTFLAPIEAIAKISQTKEDMHRAQKQLAEAFDKEQREIKEKYKKAKKQLKESHEKVKEKRKKAEDLDEKRSIKKSIAKKFLYVVLLSYFMVVLVVSLGYMVYEYNITKNAIIKDLISSEKVFGKGLGESIWNMDTSSLQSIISGMIKWPVIIGVRIVDSEEKEIGAGGGFIDDQGRYVFYSDDAEAIGIFRAQDGISGLFWHTFPVVHVSADKTENAVVGKATVYSSRQFVFERVKAGYSIFFVSTLLIALAVCFTLLRVSRVFLSQPLSILTNATAELNLKNLDSLEVDINISDRNELKILEESFNTMVQNMIEEKKTIEQMSLTFEKFLPKQFLTQIAEEGISSIKLGGMESERLTILFSQIQSFDSLSKQMDPEETYQFYNSYLSSMETPIEKHGGFVFKFNKDAIMALFFLNDPPMEALSAVYSAIDMQKALTVFNESQQKLGYEPISTGVGIHSGEVSLGTLGSETRMESTVIGDAINISERLQNLTEEYNSQILISHDTFKLLESFEAFQWRELDSIDLEGEKDSMQIFEIFDAEPAKEVKIQILEYFNEGVKSFRTRNWDRAIELFEKCLSIFPVDVVSQMYIKRSESHKGDSSGIADFLRNESELFKILDDTSIAEIAQQFIVVGYEDGETIIEQGTVGENFYIVHSGSVDVLVKDENGGEIKVADLQKGDCFGEMSLLTGEQTAANIKSGQLTELLILNKGQFENMLRKFSSLNSYFHKLFVQRLRETNIEAGQQT